MKKQKSFELIERLYKELKKKGGINTDLYKFAGIKDALYDMHEASVDEELIELYEGNSKLLIRVFIDNFYSIKGNNHDEKCYYDPSEFGLNAYNYLRHDVMSRLVQFKIKNIAKSNLNILSGYETYRSMELAFLYDNAVDEGDKDLIEKFEYLKKEYGTISDAIIKLAEMEDDYSKKICEEPLCIEYTIELLCEFVKKLKEM